MSIRVRRVLRVLSVEELELRVAPAAVVDVTPDVVSPFVSASGTGFVADGGPFYVAGTNCYYLMTFDSGSRMAGAKRSGAPVNSVWGFAALSREPPTFPS